MACTTRPPSVRIRNAADQRAYADGWRAGVAGDPYHPAIGSLLHWTDGWIDGKAHRERLLARYAGSAR